MEISYTDEKIEFQKEVNSLDKFVIEFTSVLNKIGIQYVIVSGYVSILFGRNRSSEDVDLIVKEIDMNSFRELWKMLNEKYECLNTENISEAYNEYLKQGLAIRFSEKNNFIPNMEFKFSKIELERWVLSNKRKVSINSNTIFISPFELQISFKLALGSEKDIEDAKYLYGLFKEQINYELLHEFNRKLKVEELFNKYIR